MNTQCYANSMVTSRNQQAFTLLIINLLIARYYVHLARSKLETTRLDVFIVLLKTKFSVKEKSLLKPETTPNTEISGPPCTFLICVVTSRVNELKYVMFFFFLVFFCFLCLQQYRIRLGCVNLKKSYCFFFFLFGMSYMASLFYYSMYLCCITVTYLFNIDSNKK